MERDDIKLMMIGVLDQYVGEQVKRIDGAVETLERRMTEVERKTRVMIKPSWLHIVMLIAVVGFTGWLIWHGYAEKPDVSIEYNVGEIIGGILGGAGAAVAGVAYATKVAGARE